MAELRTDAARGVAIPAIWPPFGHNRPEAMTPTAEESARISPTAHYTGYVWCRHGLAPAEWATREGRAMYAVMKGPMMLASLTNHGMTLEKMLLQRHRVIDWVLERAIATGEIGQIVEVAAGHSGRGLRFTRRHPELTYVEGDLPAVALRKRAMLARVGWRASARHEVVELDALADHGPHSLFEAVGPRLDRARGTAIVTEGLLGYFPWSDVAATWRRFARLLGDFPAGLYTSDAGVASDARRSPLRRAFLRFLGVVARGKVHQHFADEAAMRVALADAGFPRSEVHVPSALAAQLGLPTGDDVVRVLEARPDM
jgi:O-methyltransferase involved in polyketide biosynthesis